VRKKLGKRVNFLFENTVCYLTDFVTQSNTGHFLILKSDYSIKKEIKCQSQTEYYKLVKQFYFKMAETEFTKQGKIRTDKDILRIIELQIRNKLKNNASNKVDYANIELLLGLKAIEKELEK